MKRKLNIIGEIQAPNFRTQNSTGEMASLTNLLQDEENEEIEDEKRAKRQVNQMQTCLDPNSIKQTTRQTK